MPRKLIRFCIITFFALLLPLRLVSAADTNNAEKKELIKQILEVTNVKAVAQSTIDNMLKNMDEACPTAMSEVLNGLMGESAVKQITEIKTLASNRFKELYPETINLDQIIERVYYPLYDKFFTVDDLKDLLKFYESNIGKKYVQVAPQLLQEAMKQVQEMVGTQLTDLMGKVFQEQAKIFKENKEKLQLQGNLTKE